MILLKDLEIYQLAMQIGEQSWQMVQHWDFFARDTLSKQTVRAADSIALNIAEGYGRFHYKENKQFCYYGRGSAYKTKSCLAKALERKLLSTDQFDSMNNKLEILLKKLNSYINTIGNFEKQADKQ